MLAPGATVDDVDVDDVGDVDDVDPDVEAAVVGVTAVEDDPVFAVTRAETIVPEGLGAAFPAGKNAIVTNWLFVKASVLRLPW